MSKKDSLRLEDDKRVAAAKQVKTLRLEMGMTQQELADAAGVTRQSVSNIEIGATRPQKGTLARILDVLGVSSVESDLSQETQLWLGILSGMLEALPSDRRAVAGQAAVTAVTQELVAASARSKHTPEFVGGPEHTDELAEHSDYELAAHADYTLAARKRSKDRGEVDYD